MELQSLRQEAEELRKKIKVNGGPMRVDKTRLSDQIRSKMSCYSCANPRGSEGRGISACSVLPSTCLFWGWVGV